MGFERRSFALSKEEGVLPGSEFFITTDNHHYLDYCQYLIMCGHYTCDQRYQIDRLYHDYLLIAYIVSGGLRVDYEGESHTARAGDVVAIDLRKPHFYGAADSLEFYWLHVRGTVSEQIYRTVYQRFGPILGSGLGQKTSERMRLLLTALKTGQQLSSRDMSVAVYEIMLHLLPAEEPGARSSSNKAVAVAIEYMKYNLGNPVSLTDIASATHLSKYHFARVFKAQTGCSPYDYLKKLRLDTAKYLLSTTKNTVKEIAFSVGYQSEMGFILAFTETVGVSPGRFRNMPF